MPVKIVRYQCNYCKTSSPFRRDCRIHEEECKYNPANKTCFTCRYSNGFTNSGSQRDPIFEIKCTCERMPGTTKFMTRCYDWENKNLYRFISWRHASDAFTLHVIGFWNPADLLFYQAVYDSNPFAGKGFQVMLVYNHQIELANRGRRG